jgi:cytochrome c oxidase cbb3-type subunit 3
MRARRDVSTLLLVLALVSCEREQRPFRVQPPDAAVVNTVELTTLRAGPSTAPTTLPAQHAVRNDYEQNAWAMAEGKRLFSQMNCVGCHANGGGGMGPPLIDEDWIYGSEPAQVFATIVQGRPNGMPSFRGRLPDHQVWQLAAYVRSISGLVRTDAAPGRNDDMQANPPEHSVDTPKPPRQSTRPPSGEMPR